MFTASAKNNGVAILPDQPDVEVHERRDRPLNIHLAATWHLLQPQVVGHVGLIRITHSSLALWIR